MSDRSASPTGQFTYGERTTLPPPPTPIRKMLVWLEENTEALLVGSKETGLEVTADKTKYNVTSRDQNAGRSQSIKTDNSSFERAEELNIWEQPLQIKILFRKKLRAD